MKIETSLDWGEVGGELTRQLKQVPYNSDLRKFIRNIDTMVTELSKLEVEARRIRNTSYLSDKINEINKAINHLEKLILMALLMR